MGSYAYWVSHPPSQYEAVFQEALQRQRKLPATTPNLSQLDAEIAARSRTFQERNIGKLKPAELHNLQSELKSSQWKDENYVLAYERSILDFPEELPALNGVYALPGMTAREVRLFKNDFTAQLERVRAGEDFRPLAGDAALDWDWVCGRHGVLRSPFLKPVPDCHEQFQQVRRRQAFVHLLTGILLERAQTGQWPISLEEMPGFEPLPELDRKAVHYYALGETLEVSWLDWTFKP